jgi:choline dehydrogenase-like flavoprotein
MSSPSHARSPNPATQASAKRQDNVVLGYPERRTLEAVAETFFPGAVHSGVPDAFLEAFVSALSGSERRRLRALLAALAVSGFTRARPDRRERALRAWCDSRLPLRRAGFQALRKGLLTIAYTLPGTPAWERIGYPGPLGRRVTTEPRLAPLRLVGDTTLDCDVCVAGSGAGGGVAASVLAGAGLDVVVLEAGGHYEDADFDGAELDGLRRLYHGRGTTATDDQGIGILAGACLGGGTVVNYTTSFRTPDEIRAEWGGMFETDTFSRALDTVCGRLGVNTDHNRLSKREEVVSHGLRSLGWHEARMPRNVRGCDQDGVCGYCGYGCPLGAKQSTARTWLVDAQAAGARIVVRTRAERVLLLGGRARGVEARTAEGHGITVRCRAVVVACGAIETPALLRRSGLTAPGLGRNLHLHPVGGAFGVFDEEIRPWEGTLQAIYSDEVEGVKLETTAIHPALLAGAAPWRSAEQHAELMSWLPRISLIGVLLRDLDAGEVRVGRDGRPVVRYRLSGRDAARMRAGTEAAARVLEAAGARRIVSSHARLVQYEPGRSGSIESFLSDADAAGWGPGRIALYSFHQMGTAAMGSVCHDDGGVAGTKGLVVADASAFPSASGVNPMVTIEAIAYVNASALAAKIGSLGGQG